MVTTEIRRDPITGRSVVIDRAPFKRRDVFELDVVRLEWGSGMYRNPVAPEEAARVPRER